MALAIGNERQFARTAEVLGHPEWASDERFNSNRARVEHRAVIDGLINQALAQDDADAWLAKLMAVGVPCGRQRFHTVPCGVKNSTTRLGVTAVCACA